MTPARVYSLLLVFLLVSRLYYCSPPDTHQVVLSTAHPAKFSEAVTSALGEESSFNFERDVLPPEFKGLLEKPRRVIDVPSPEIELVKQVIIKTLG